MNSQSPSVNKITPPGISGILPRERLYLALDQSFDRPAVWVNGEGGAGKSTLVAGYLGSRKIPCLWYQVDRGDADIATLFSYLALAVEQVCLWGQACDIGISSLGTVSIGNTLDGVSVSVTKTGDIIPFATSITSAGSAIPDGGHFFFTLPYGSYTVTPSKTGHTFTPKSITVLAYEPDKTYTIDFFANPLTDNGDGTIYDAISNLTWLKNANCFGGQTWVSAISKCILRRP